DRPGGLWCDRADDGGPAVLEDHAVSRWGAEARHRRKGPAPADDVVDLTACRNAPGGIQMTLAREGCGRRRRKGDRRAVDPLSSSSPSRPSEGLAEGAAEDGPAQADGWASIGGARAPATIDTRCAVVDHRTHAPEDPAVPVGGEGAGNVTHPR